MQNRERRLSLNTGVFNATYQVIRLSVHVFCRIRFLKVITIYGLGGHIGHMTGRLNTFLFLPSLEALYEIWL